MNVAVAIRRFRTFGKQIIASWDRFWFTAIDPSMLCGMRILCGLFLLYSHVVLASDLMAWIGPEAWVNSSLAADLHNGTYAPADAAWSYLWHIRSPIGLWIHHAVVIIVAALMTAGIATRVTVPLSWFFQLMIVHRLTGVLFGFDQIVTYMVMYLSIAPCGVRFSIDAMRRPTGRIEPSVMANIAMRLLQIHLCVIYLFGGLAKARGQSWWDGTAMWYSIGNLEYQSIDMTWMADWPRLFSAMTHITLFWELFYVALIWPRLTRPLVLAGAVVIHGGIAIFLGMMTFGLAMITANLVFVPWSWFEKQPVGGEDHEKFEIYTPQELARRTERLKENEAKYRQRVARLKQREAKIKEAAERKRQLDDSELHS